MDGEALLKSEEERRLQMFKQSFHNWQRSYDESGKVLHNSDFECYSDEDNCYKAPIKSCEDPKITLLREENEALKKQNQELKDWIVSLEEQIVKLS